MKSQNEPEAGKYDYDRTELCTVFVQYYRTFSAGIFKYLPKASGKGLKRGKIIYRVKGDTDYPQAVYDRADEIVNKLNNNSFEHLRMIKTFASETVPRRKCN